MKAVKKTAVTLLGLLLFITLATPVHAVITEATAFETASKMYQLGILQGKGTLPSGDIDFDLGSNLTRAEFFTTIVRAFGAEQAARFSKPVASFADVSDDTWYSGYVAVAQSLGEQLGINIGKDADTFDPNAPVTKAEALYFMLLFLGISVDSAPEKKHEAWIQQAVELGIISEQDAEVAFRMPDAPATRGEAFIFLDFGYSAKILEGGQSLYTSFVDSVPPVLTLDSYPDVTTASEVRLTGSIRDNKGVAAFAISDGTLRTLINIEDLKWQTTVSLKPGLNTFTLEAVDIAGNKASKQVEIKYVPANRLVIRNAPSLHAAGYPYQFIAELLDAEGNVIETDIPVTWSASGGSIDQNGRFISHASGTYTITAAWGDLVDTARVEVVTLTYPAPPSLRIHPIADLVWREGETVSFTPSADIPTDASSSARYSVSVLPSWLALNELTGELYADIPYNAAGEYHLTYTLAAYDYQPVTVSFKITVLDTDTTPYWDSGFPLLWESEWENKLIEIPLIPFVYDDDGDELYLEGVDLDPNLVLDDGILYITAPGNYTATIKVKDNTPSADPSLDEATITLTLIVKDIQSSSR
jgi:hypothetical protein